MAATLTILDKMQITPSMKAGKLVASLKSKLERWAPLLQKMGIGIDEEKSIVKALETAAVGGGDIGEALSAEPNFRFMLQTLHDEEIVTEEAVLAWAADRRETDPESDLGKLFNQQPTQDFLEWLNEDSSDEDDESSDEED